MKRWFRAQVVAWMLTLPVTEQTQEELQPGSERYYAVNKWQKERRVGALGPMGVTGALANQPPGGWCMRLNKGRTGGNVGEDGEWLLKPSFQGSSRKRSTRNFEL